MNRTGTRFKGKAVIAALVLLLTMSSISPSLLAADKSINVTSSTIFMDDDWIVSDTNVTEDKIIILNGNLTITSTGSLTLNNVTLKINQSANGEYTLNVNSGGEFYVDKSNITSNNSYRYWFEVYGKLQMNNSKLSRTYAQVGKWGGIHVYSDDVYVGNSTFFDYSGAGMTIETSNTTIYNTTFLNGFRGIWAWYWGNITVEKCTFVGSVDAALKIMYDVGLYVGNSTIRDGMDGIEASGDTDIAVFNLTAVNNTIGAGGVGIWLRSNSKANIVKFNGTNNLFGIWVDVESNATIFDSIFRDNNKGIEVSSNANATIINSKIENNTQIGVQVTSSNATIVNCTISNNINGLRVGGGYYNTTATNSTFVGNGIGVDSGSANTTLLNSTVSGSTSTDYSLSSEGRIFVKWFLHANVIDLNSNPIPNANVQAHDKYNTLVFDGNTGFDGWRKWIPVTNRSMYRPGINPVETTYYDPQNITAEYNAVSNYTEVAMDTSKEVTIKLDIEIETNPPVIEHTPIITAKVGKSINISANVSDYSGVGNVILYYQNVGEMTYTPIDMNLTSGNNQSGNWNATIPTQTETGLAHYFLWANDTFGNNITSPIMGDYAIQITGPPTVEIISPIGNEDWTGGNIHQIEFTASDTEDAPADLDVFLNYTSTTAGDGFIAQIKGDDSPYDWTLPSIDATDVKINATVIDSDGNKSYDDSLEFTIDSTPPEVVSTNPANNSTGISVFQPIVIQFNEPINISSVIVNQTNGTDPGGWNWFWNENKDTITGIHDAWDRGENVEITVQENYYDDSAPGNANNTDYVFSFTTEINPSPEIVHTNISESQGLGDAIRINATITDDGTVMIAVVWWQDVDDVWHENYMQRNGDNWEYIIPGQMIEGKVRYQINATDDLGQKNTTMIYEVNITDTTPPVIVHTSVEGAIIGEPINITCEVTDLGGVNTSAVYFVYRYEGDSEFMVETMNPGFWFELPVHSAPTTIEYYLHALDIYGNEAMTQLYSLEIIDSSIPDTTPPEILLVIPTGDNITISTTISIVFSEAMDKYSVENAITIMPVISGISYLWSSGYLVLTIGFSDNLSHNTTYNITLGTGARDISGNNITSPYSWEFTTEEQLVSDDNPPANDYIWVVVFLIIVILLLCLWLYYQTIKGKEEPGE